MLKTFNKARICCPVFVYEEINAFFWKEKDPNVTNLQKLLNLTFLCKFCQFFDRSHG